jgi:Glycosyltransferase 61
VRVKSRLMYAVSSALARTGALSSRCHLVTDESYEPLRGIADWLADRTGSPELVAGIRAFEKHIHPRWAYDIHAPALVEPRAGYVFVKGGLIQRSFAYWFLYRGPSGAALLGYCRWIAGVGEIRHLPVAVSFRDASESNYWHFHDDVLSKLNLLDDLGLPPTTPLLVGSQLWHCTWFMEMRSTTELRDRTWVLHDQPICTDRLIVGHPGSLRRRNAVLARRILSPTVPAGSAVPELIYVSRGSGRRRHVANDNELSLRLASEGFLRVDADDLSFVEQVETFRAARCVVLVHGAGLANLVHRIGLPTAVVEVFPADYVAPHLVWLAREFGFEYRAVMGEARSGDESFHVDVDRVAAAALEALSALAGSA